MILLQPISNNAVKVRSNIKSSSLALRTVLEDKSFKKDIARKALVEMLSLLKDSRINNAEEILGHIVEILNINKKILNPEQSREFLNLLKELVKEGNLGNLKTNKDKMSRISRFAMALGIKKELIENAYVFGISEDKPVWKNAKKGWVEYDKYISYMLYDYLVMPKKLEYKNQKSVLGNFAQKIKKNKNTKKERLDILIERQSGERWSRVVELIANGIDASVPDKIGRFGKGFQQTLQELESERDRVIVRTTVSGQEYGRCIEYKRENGKYYIREHKYDTTLESHGTKVQVLKDEELSYEEKAGLEEYISNKYKNNRRLKIILENGDNRKVLNPVQEVKDINGKDVIGYESPKEVILRIHITDNGYEVVDEGSGMNDETIFEHLLLPQHSTKSSDKDGESLYYKKASSKEQNATNCKILVMVSGVNVLDYDVSGLNLPEELIIELPVNTKMPDSRNAIVIDEVVVDGLSRLIDGIKIKDDDKYKVLNALIKFIQILKAKKEEDQIIQNKLGNIEYKIKSKLKEEIKKEANIVFLPNLNGFEYIETMGKEVKYIDEDVCPVESIDKIPGMTRIENFISKNGYKMYRSKLKPVSKDIEKPIFLKFGNVIIIDEEVYKLNVGEDVDNREALYGESMLNLLLNFWIGYGDKPEIIGELKKETSKKREKENTESKTSKNKQEEVNKKKENTKSKTSENEQEKVKKEKENTESKTSKNEQEKVNKKKENTKSKTSNNEQEKVKKEKVKDENGKIQDIVSEIEKKRSIKNMPKEFKDILGKIIAVRIAKKDDVAKIKSDYQILCNRCNQLKYWDISLLQFWYEKISDVKIVGEDVYSTVSKDKMWFLLKNSVEIEGQGEGYNNIEDVRIVGKDVYCTAQKGSQYFLLKNGVEMEGQGKGYYLIYKVTIAGEDVYYAVRKGKMWFVLKNGVEMEGQGEGYDSVDDLTIAGDDVYYAARKGKMWFVLKNGVEMEGQGEGYDSVDDLTIAGDDVYYAARKGKMWFVLKNGVEMEGQGEGYDSVDDLTIAGDDVYYAARKGEMWFILKNGKDLDGQGEGYDSVDNLTIAGDDVYYAAKKDGMYFVLKNGKRIHDQKEGYDNIEALTIAGEDVYWKAKKDRMYFVLKNGKKLDGQGKGYDNIDDLIITGDYVYYVAQKDGMYFVLKNGEIFSWIIHNASTGKLDSKNIEAINQFITDKFLEKELINDYLNAIIQYGDMGLGDAFNTLAIQSGIYSLGEKFRDYIQRKLFTEDWLKSLSERQNAWDINEWMNFWSGYYLISYLDLKMFNRYSERWELLYSLDKETAEYFNNVIKNYYFFDLKYKDIKDETKDFQQLFFDEELNILKEKDEDMREDEKWQKGDINISKLVLLVKNNKKINSMKALKKGLVKLNNARISHLVDKFISIIKGQSTDRNIYIRELIQNSRDAGEKRIKIEYYLRKKSNKEDKRESVFKVKDGVGMDIKNLINNLMIPNSSGKIKRDNVTGFFGIGFWTTAQSGDVIEVRTGNGTGLSYFVRMRVKKTAEGELEDIIIEKFAEYKDKYKGTEVSVINEYDDNSVVRAHIEGLGMKRRISKLVGGACSEHFKLESDKEKDQKNSRIEIYYNDQKVILKREVLSEVNVKDLGKVTLLRSDSKISAIEHKGLFVQDMNKKWLKYVPSVFRDMVKTEGLIIELPEKVPLISSRNDIAHESEYLDPIQRAVSLVIMRACLYLYKERGIRVPDLPQDFFWKKYAIEKPIIVDAERINRENYDRIDLEKYVENYVDAIKLLVLVTDPRKSESIKSIAEVVQSSDNLNMKADVNLEIANGAFKREVNEAKKKNQRENQEKKEVSKKIKAEDISDKQKKLANLCKWIYSKTGVGFSDVEYYEKNEARLANYYPVYNRNSKEIEWEIIFNIRHIDRWSNLISDDQETKTKTKTELIYKSDRDTFLESLMHEYTHTIEYEKGLRVALERLNILSEKNKENMEIQKLVEICKESYIQHFCSLFKYNQDAGEVLVNIDDTNVKDIINNLTLLGGVIKNDKEKNIARTMLADLRGDGAFGIRYHWTHQSNGVSDDSFARIMKGVLEDVVRSGQIAYIDEGIRDADILSYIQTNIGMESIERGIIDQVFFKVISSVRKMFGIVPDKELMKFAVINAVNIVVKDDIENKTPVLEININAIKTKMLAV
jgi:hypothetical protein